MTSLLGLLILATPPTLGDGLRAIGALQAVDHTLTPPPPPARVGARILLATSGVALAAGVVGSLVSDHCATRDAEGRCIDAQSSWTVFPALIVLGLGGLTTGAAWYRKDLPDAP